MPRLLLLQYYIETIEELNADATSLIDGTLLLMLGFCLFVVFLFVVFVILLFACALLEPCR